MIFLNLYTAPYFKAGKTPSRKELMIFVLLFIVGLMQVTGKTITNNTVIANNDFVKLSQGEEIKINVLNNDFGLEDGVSELNVVIDAEYGSTEVTEDNHIIYTPNPSFNGKDELTYEVCNTDGSCDKAKVNIEVSYYNYIPVAINDTAFIFTNETFSINVLTNDKYLFDTPLDISILVPLNHGYTTINDDNTISPSFDLGFTGIDSLQYQVCDIDDDCDNAWLFITIENKDGHKVFIPEGISPNGDGLNDTFFVPDFKDKEMVIQVINNLGEVVFKDSDYQNNWDCISNTGKFSGQLLKQGTYYYTIKLTQSNLVYTGFIYINW